MKTDTNLYCVVYFFLCRQKKVCKKELVAVVGSLKIICASLNKFQLANSYRNLFRTLFFDNLLHAHLTICNILRHPHIIYAQGWSLASNCDVATRYTELLVAISSCQAICHGLYSQKNQYNSRY